MAISMPQLQTPPQLEGDRWDGNNLATRRRRRGILILEAQDRQLVLYLQKGKTRCSQVCL